MKNSSVNFISYKEAAQMLGLSVHTIKNWAKQGTITRYPITYRSVFVDRDEILEMISQAGEKERARQKKAKECCKACKYCECEEEI
ncbi:MAG: helix-turn-helix transcriptional regulator [Wolinella sp.]